MSYSLTKLAPGSYDILVDGKIIGGIVRGGTPHAPVWIAELLYDLPPERRPVPFIELEHEFTSLEAVCAWLDILEIRPDS